MMKESFSDNTNHFAGFQNIWKGGYFEGDPLDPMGASKYRRLGYISVLYAVYQACVRPHINSRTVALEIGPGRGAWTKALLPSKEVWCLDAKSREENGIDSYLGYPQNLIYHKVSSFSCDMLPDDEFDYLFSFGCLCHVPWNGVMAYARNIFPKLKSGAHAYWMVADYDKRNAVSARFPMFDIYARTLPSKVLKLLEWWNSRSGNRFLGPNHEPSIDKERDGQGDAPGRWYHSGAASTADMLRSVGYQVVSEDVGLVPRDAILHFRKP